MSYRIAATAALLSLTGSVFACSSTDTMDDTVEEEQDAGPIADGMTAACSNGQLLYCAGFKPGAAVDFVGFRSEQTSPRPSDAGVGAVEAAWTATLETADTFGTPCSGATDQAACQKKLADLRVLGDSCQGVPIVPKDVAGGASAAPAQSGSCSTRYLVYTRGDEIDFIADFPQAVGFFGTIDSPQEALYLAYLSGESLPCSGAVQAAYVAKGDGYDLQTGSYLRCSGNATGRIVHVSSAGKISVVSDGQTESGDDCASSH